MRVRESGMTWEGYNQSIESSPIALAARELGLCYTLSLANDEATSSKCIVPSSGQLTATSYFKTGTTTHSPPLSDEWLANFEA